ncbi:MAG: hypothetical protein L0H83_10085 [Salinisphaera sp.]|nr:hypothetical protein [Salinisphaera sp.]
MNATIVLHPATITRYDHACEWTKDMIAQGYDVFAVFSPNGTETIEARPRAVPVEAVPPRAAPAHTPRKSFWGGHWPRGAA